MKKIGIYVFDDFEEIGSILLYTILKKTKTLKDANILPIKEPLTVEFISNNKTTKGTKDLLISTHKTTTDFSEYDVLVIPGGKGIEKLLEEKQLLENISNFGKQKMICSVGMGSLLLGKAGLLENKKATTHHKQWERLRKYCTVESKRIVVSDNIITAGGMLCAVDLALKIIEKIYTKIISDIIADYIESPRKPKGIRMDIGETDIE
jgi:cyclohexyl-isocyanide hydratase